MKSYDHKKIEKKWQREWQKKKVYKTQDKSKKKKYYVLDMFPYPSGEGLHVGHPKGYIATDILSRMRRMQGRNVLHPMGFDAFGLPAENYAIKTKTNPEIAVKKNVARYKKQLEILGLDYDWSREVNTTDPKYYKWTQWIFLKMLEKGLAFESNEPVNWCPKDKTVLANEDVEDGRCERCGTLVEKRPMRQWVLKITDYADRMLKDLELLDWPESIKESQRNWIGRSEGAEIGFKIEFAENQKTGEIPVFTTRADTLYGATFLVLSPEHLWVILSLDDKHKGVLKNADEVRTYVLEAKKKTEIERTDASREKTGVKLEGVWAVNPATNEQVPIFVADYVLADYGTGAVMGVPAHDERDFEFAKKYNLPIKQVVARHFADAQNPFRPGKETIFRNVVHSIVVNPRDGKVLCLEWKNFPWNTFVIGGIEGNETAMEAAIREIREETGYKNLKFIKKLAGPFINQFYAAHKDINRTAKVDLFLFELENDEKEVISEEENTKHKIVWIEKNELKNFLKGIDEKDYEIDAFERGEETCFVGEGLVVNSPGFELMNTEDAREKITNKFGKKVVKYRLKDWVFSRQRYWGEPIPVLKDGSMVIPVAEKDLPVKLPKVKSYEPTGTGESPLANISKWVNVRLKGKDGKWKMMKRETNTMPQWAGSSWYYLRYMDPKNNKKLVDPKVEKYWGEVDMYVGGAEHATRHLIYARFWHKFLYDIGVVSTTEPFQKLQSVGLIMGEDGRKMSKRFGNVVNPDKIVETWGADSLRLYEMFMGPFADSIAWNTDNMIGVRRFLEKVWRLQAKLVKKPKIEDKKLVSLLHKTVKKVAEDISEMKFNTAISSMMILVNEMEKSEQISVQNFEMFTKILAPFAPHMTEEIWRNMRNKKSLHLEKWPAYDPKKIEDEEVKIGVQVNGKVRGEIILSKEAGEEEVKNQVLKMPEVTKWTEGKEIKKFIYVPGRVINIVVA